MNHESNHLPRIFQANIDRLYRRVVHAGLDQLPTHRDALIDGPVPEEECLARLAKQVDNHTAEEARRACALMLAAVFERQLRLWCLGVLPQAGYSAVTGGEILKLLGRAVTARGLVVPPDVQAVIEEVVLLANVIRHGDGRSSEALRRLAPRLWIRGSEPFDQAMPASPLTSDGIRVGPDDLRRYAATLIRFWGAADTLPMAVVDAPY